MKRGYYFYFTIHFTGSKKENGVNGCYTLKYPHNSSNSERQIDVFESMNSARTVLICLTGMVIMAFTVYSPVYSVQDSKGIKSQNVDLVLIISMEHRSLNIVRDSLFDILSIICFEKKMCLDRKQNV